MPRGRICPRCMRIHVGAGTRHPECQQADDRRRHAKQRIHGRTTQHWQRIRIATLKRDGYRCQRCQRTEDLTVHLRPELEGNHRTATVDDCVTLCRRCHGTIDAPRSKGG